MTLPGLMSRCTTPARCEYSSAVRMPSTMRTASAGSSGPSAMMSLSSLPVDVLHDDERHLDLVAVRVAHRLFAGVEDAHDRGVRHARGGLRLLAEAGAEGRVVGERRASAA